MATHNEINTSDIVVCNYTDETAVMLFMVVAVRHFPALCGANSIWKRCYHGYLFRRRIPEYAGEC